VVTQGAWDHLMKQGILQQGSNYNARSRHRSHSRRGSPQIDDEVFAGTDPDEARPTVVMSVLGGRERYLQILKTYTDILLEQGSVTEVHIWDYTRTESDKRYCEQLCAGNDKYKLMRPSRRVDFKDYYEFYLSLAQNYTDGNAMLVKSDDDIVYIDVAAFDKFIDAALDDGQRTLYFPNIVNNDVCALLQSRGGVHGLMPEDNINTNVMVYGSETPLSNLQDSPEMASEIHAKFLKDPSLFTMEGYGAVRWGSNIPPNMFAVPMIHVKEMFGVMTQQNLDERFLTGPACLYFQRPNALLLELTVSHFAFYGQASEELDEKFLSGYAELGRKVVRQLNSDDDENGEDPETTENEG